MANNNNSCLGGIYMEINEEKRQKFVESAGKRVNNVIHDIEILEPMTRLISI